MPGEAKTRSVKRATVLAAAMAGWTVLIGARLIQLQVIRHEHYRKQSEAQISSVEEVRAPRGSICDREGRNLALSVPCESIVVNPMRAPEPAITAGILAPILGLDPQQLEARLEAAARQRRGFLWVKRKVSFEEAERLRGLRLDWIEFRRESLRAYPKSSLAAHVLGGVDYRERGNGGIEQSLDGELGGKPGTVRVVRDVIRRGVDSQPGQPALAGKTIVLTIDERLQHVAERELAKAVESSHSQTGSVVVMDPKNGEILAMASYPFYDPNVAPASGNDLERRANHALSVPFEPGSVFKVVTVAAALETTRLTPETVVNAAADGSTFSAASSATIIPTARFRSPTCSPRAATSAPSRLA
jgi:cell division protein FtsI/penicillin-binding protein 2